MSVKEIIIWHLCFYALVSLLGWALVSYLSLPVVAKNHITGECEWVDELGQRESCPDKLPRKYITIQVGTEYGKSTTE